MAEKMDREQTVVLRWRRRVACETLVPSLNRAFPTDQVNSFDEALNAIDDAESAVWGNENGADQPPE